ncbi:MAG: zinc-ribbon domain-containing protein [Candidatus Lokiarchaeota archaeon]
MAIKPPVNTPIIIDIGSAYCKIGFAGDFKPRFVFPTITGTEKYQTVMLDVSARNVYVGNDAMKMRGVLKIKRPIQRQQIMDWDEYYEMLNHIFYNLLRVESMSTHPVLYVESPFVQNDTKEYIARVLFETHQANSLIMAPSPVLACISVGLTTGLVIESGDGITWIVPIIDGKIITQAVQRLYLAGMDITNNLKSLLMREGINITSSAVEEILREIKEKNCYFAIDPENPPPVRDNYHYSMPDGSTVDIPSQILYEAPEVLFQPGMIGSNSPNITQAIIKSIKSINKEYWSELLSHIVLSGGNFYHPGFEERLKVELNSSIQQLGPIPKPKIYQNLTEDQKLEPTEGIKKTKDTCPNCGTIVDLSTTNTCPKCGNKLESPKISINLDTTGNKTIVCPSCGREISDKGSKFCPFCGNSLEGISKDSNPSEPKEISDVSTSEYDDLSSDIVKFFIPENPQYAIFNGGSILASLPSFQNLFISLEEFQSDKNLLYRDISEIF